jgi:hypothetical protein
MPRTRKREAAYGEPPVPDIRKTGKDAAYEKRAKTMLRDILVNQEVSYADLAIRLRRKGFAISDGGLENKIARGAFSMAFAIQCLDALGVEFVRIPRQER